MIPSTIIETTAARLRNRRRRASCHSERPRTSPTSASAPWRAATLMIAAWRGTWAPCSPPSLRGAKRRSNPNAWLLDRHGRFRALAMTLRGRPADPARSSLLHLRVEQAVDQIDDQIEQDDQDREHDHRAHDQGVVAIERALDEIAADPGNAEDGLDHDRAGHHLGGRRTEIGDDREQRALERMAEHHDALAQALGARGAHEI